MDEAMGVRVAIHWVGGVSVVGVGSGMSVVTDVAVSMWTCHCMSCMTRMSM